MDADPRSRIRQWVNLMQRYGIEPPPEVRRAALPRSPRGSYGEWATRPGRRPEPVSPPPAAAAPQMPSSMRDQGAVARQQRQRIFPVRNAPWEAG